MNLFGWVSGRLGERSTWLGLVSILTSAGIAIAPAWQEAIVSVGLGLGGAIGILSKDVKG